MIPRIRVCTILSIAIPEFFNEIPFGARSIGKWLIQSDFGWFKKHQNWTSLRICEACNMFALNPNTDCPNVDPSQRESP